MKALLLSGSNTDQDTMAACAEVLLELGIGYDCKVRSAHRTPVDLHEECDIAAGAGFSAIIGFAGGSAHLQGMGAAATTLPMFGVAAPSSSSVFNDLAAIFSQICMPAGVPVAYMGAGKQGAVNAAVEVARVFSLTDPALRQRLVAYQDRMKAKSRAMTLTLKVGDKELPTSYAGM